MSGVVENDVPLPAQYVDVELNSSCVLPDLTLDIEEADLRIIPHKMEPQAKSKHGEFYGGIQRY